MAMAFDWRNTMEAWVKKKHNKHASVVTNHLPAWICKINRDKVLSSFSAKDQRIEKDAKWEGMTPLNQEEVDSQAILDM